MISVFLVLLIPVVVIATIIAFFVALAKKDEESFEGKLRTIYLYIISLATLVMIIGGTIGTIVGATDVLFPEENYYSGYTEEQKEIYNYNNRIRAIKETVSSVGVIIVSLPVFLYHNKKALALRRKKNENKNVQ